MLFELMGAAAFGLYAIYDLNSVLWKKKFPGSFFFLGSFLLILATGGAVAQAFLNGSVHLLPGAWVLFLVLALVSFGLMVYTLFFALPFEETYVNPENQKMKVYDRGMYALCRHPGVIWFFLGYVGLGLLCGSGRIWRMGMIFSGLNVLYVVLQDRWTFLRTFDDYEGYRKRVPFLVPTLNSIKQAWRTR